jgi:CHAT domain-containing protein
LGLSWLRKIAVILLVAVLPLSASVGFAQTDLSELLASIEPETLQNASAGDAYASYEVGSTLVTTWEEANLRAALPYFKAALGGAMLSEDDFFLAAASALILGRVQTGLSDYRDGLAFAKEAERIARSLTENPEAPSLVVSAMMDQSLALQLLSRYTESLDILDILMAHYQKAEPPNTAGMADIAWNQGMAHEALGEFETALEIYGTALEFFREIEGDEGLGVAGLANNIGWVKHRSGDYAVSEIWFRLSLNIFEKKLGSYAENTGKNYINLGLALFNLDRPDEAIKIALKAMPFIAANATQTLSDQRWLFELLAKSFAAIDQPNRAIFFGKMAVNAQQAIRATNTRGQSDDTAELQAEWRRLYQLLADLLITQGRISEAQAVLNMEKQEEVFEYLRRDAAADLSKTRATLNDTELTDEAKLNTIALLPIAADQELRMLMVKMDNGETTDAQEDQIFLLQDALQQAADRFDAEVTAFLNAADETVRDVLETQFDAVGSYQEILSGLERPTAILQIAALQDAAHLFLTLPGVTLHQQVDISRADLARLVFEALQAIEEIDPTAAEKLGALHKVLFAPVQQALIDSGTEVVMLNLDGFLRYVPFAALHDGDGYLVERFAFSLYSAAVPTQFETPDRTDVRTAGFGVTAAHPGFAALPGVRRELETIFGQSGVLAGQTALDSGFDERSLKKTLLGKPSILHIASHFNLLPGQEDDSFLLLGDGSHLPLSKIRKTRALRFQGVDLLTLSACQTARGGDGAEIDGFGATAQLNGAGAVMASLWPVSDAATPILMRAFYAGLMEKGLDKAEALRQAQIAMLRTKEVVLAQTDRTAKALDAPAPAPKMGLEHPYFWSAFVLMGNWL